MRKRIMNTYHRVKKWVPFHWKGHKSKVEKIVWGEKELFVIVWFCSPEFGREQRQTIWGGSVRSTDCESTQSWDAVRVKQHWCLSPYNTCQATPLCSHLLRDWHTLLACASLPEWPCGDVVKKRQRKARQVMLQTWHLQLLFSTHLQGKKSQTVE